jgi:hypothetical protein
MVDWCIGYFVGTHKGSIASALAETGHTSAMT